MTIRYFYEAINEAIFQSMEKDPDIICYGLGVTDPMGVFGTTLNLEKNFGANRVFDMPTSENAMTGVAIGAALNGIKSIVTHQRLDFFLLAMDQLVNSAAKYHYMFGGQTPIPITIRLIIGRGWGQGPTHSQNLQAWFAHIPGLKVVCPTNAKHAKGMLISAINDPNPVIFLEHRWLHGGKSDVPSKMYETKIGKASIVSKGSDITIVASSYLVNEALIAKKFLLKQGVNAEIIDLMSYKPIDYKTIIKSVKKTKNLLVLDSGYKTCSFATEIISTITQECFNIFSNAPSSLTMPDCPEPTSYFLTKDFYIDSVKVIKHVQQMLGIKKNKIKTDKIKKHHDVPGDFFNGPF